MIIRCAPYSGGDFQATIAQTSECKPSFNFLSALNHEAFIHTMANSTTATIRTRPLSDGEAKSQPFENVPIEQRTSSATLAKKLTK